MAETYRQFVLWLFGLAFAGMLSGILFAFVCMVLDMFFVRPRTGRLYKTGGFGFYLFIASASVLCVTIVSCMLYHPWLR